MECHRDIITVPSDGLIDVVLTDGTGRVISPTGRHTVVRLRVQRAEFDAICDDIGKEYVSCSIETVRLMAVQLPDGGLRLSQSDGAAETDVECITVAIPSGTFAVGGVLDIAVCDIQEDTHFPDGRRSTWTRYADSRITYTGL